MKKLVTRRNEFYLSAVLYEFYLLAFLLVRYFKLFSSKAWPFCSLFCVFAILFLFTILAFFLDGKSKNPCWFHLVLSALSLYWASQALVDCFFFQENDANMPGIQWGFAVFFLILALLFATGFILTKKGLGQGRYWTAVSAVLLFLVSFGATIVFLFVLAKGGSHPNVETMGFVLIAFTILPSVFGFLSAFQNAKENPRP
jgi:hypothetical protein